MEHFLLLWHNWKMIVFCIAIEWLSNCTVVSQSKFFSLNSTAKVRILKRIPKGARKQSSLKLASILVVLLSAILAKHGSMHLLHFSSRGFRVPETNHCNRSLSTRIKQQLVLEQDPTFTHTWCRRGGGRLRCFEEESLVTLWKNVSEKLEDVYIKGAVRLASYNDRLANFNDENLAALQSKHPGTPPNSPIPPPPQPISDQVNELDVAV